MLVDQNKFNEFVSQGYNRIPLMRKVLADLDTPLSTYLKLASGSYSYLFESVQGGEKWGRYSIIGLPCQTIFRIRGDTLTVEQDGDVVDKKEVDDPLAAVRELQAQFRVPEVDGLPRFTGGLVGYFGYDTVRYIESHLGPSHKPDPINAPDILLMVSDEVAVFDNLAGCIYLVLHVDPSRPNAYEQGVSRIAEMQDALERETPRLPTTGSDIPVDETDFTSSFSQADFEAAVERCREYIYNGDIFQVVLSQRLSIPFDAYPLDMYRALRHINPSPYMIFLDLDEFQIVGSSPEILVRLEDNLVTVRPIAGTRRRGYDEEEDLKLELELKADPKELAEHLMLVDLGRNDAGRVAKTGTVRLTEKMEVERYSHVMHIVSNVVGELAEGLDAVDVLGATFPAGTVSGAPKVRAMEIIDELEPTKRGIYAGAIGYIGWNGNMDTAIAIRTAVIADGTLHIQAGAGIVADSVPSLEWKETMNKGRAIFKAVEAAVKGIDRGFDEQ